VKQLIINKTRSLITSVFSAIAIFIAQTAFAVEIPKYTKSDHQTARDFIFSEKFKHFHKKEDIQNKEFRFIISREVAFYAIPLFFFVQSFSKAALFPGMKYETIKGGLNEVENYDEENIAVLIFKNRSVSKLSQSIFKNEYCHIGMVSKEFKIQRIEVNIFSNNEKENFICGAISVFASYGFLNTEKIYQYMRIRTGAPYYLMHIVYGGLNFKKSKPGLSKSEMEAAWGQ